MERSRIRSIRFPCRWTFVRSRIKHWLAKSQSGRHQLGGYGQYQQLFPEELIEKKHMLLLQFACDANALTEWGDGAEVTFLVASKAMAKGRFENILGDCQGG